MSFFVGVGIAVVVVGDVIVVEETRGDGGIERRGVVDVLGVLIEVEGVDGEGSGGGTSEDAVEEDVLNSGN